MTRGPATPPPPPPEEGDAADTPEVRIFLFHRGPKFEHAPLSSGSSKDSELLSDLRYSMAGDARTCGYAILARLINNRRLISEDGGPPKRLVVMEADPKGETFLLSWNFKLFQQLSYRAQEELLQFELLRIPYGHFSNRFQNLARRYGPEIAGRALQMVIAQLVNSALLAEEGIILPVPELWNFERGLTADEYAEKLKEAGDGTMPSPVNAVIVINGGVPGGKGDEQLREQLRQLLDKHGLTNLDNVPALEESPDAPGSLITDELVRNLLQTVDDILRREHNTDLKNQGWIAGDAAEYIAALRRRPRVTWVNRMRGFCGQHAGRRWRPNPRRPSRRLPPEKLPDGRTWAPYIGRRRDRLTVVLFVADTSGSMGKRELRCVESELLGLHVQGMEIYFMQVDASVAQPPVLYRPGHKVDKFFGRGGTSFRPAFAYAEETMIPRPNCIVYFTDGYGDAPEEPSEIDTLWVLTSSGRSIDEFRKNVCSWGSAIRIDVDET